MKISPHDSPALLVAILGPTASGKSALGVHIAERWGGEVLACDSTQVYRGFDIGTAKPDDNERRGVPHHLLDLADPRETFTAGEYRRRAEIALSLLRARGRLPVVTVGTGLYFRVLIEGLSDAPQRSEELRQRLEMSASEHGTIHLHRVLKRMDPAAALRIAPRDQQKLMRAIEVCLLAGKAITEVHRKGKDPLKGFVPLRIGLNPPRAALYRRIEERVHRMIKRGWAREAENLIASGAPADAKPFEFIGYRQLRGHLEGKLSLEAAIAAITQATRHYAKRQLTWFRREPDVTWVEGFGDEPETIDLTDRLLAKATERPLPAISGKPI